MSDVDSVAFYRAHADDFFARTVNVDAAPLYGMFLPHVPAGGRLLDAGCGSGRDAAVFARRGYAVDAFDAAPELVARARQHTGLDVQVARFEDLEADAVYDGIWTCACLLHVPRGEAAGVYARLHRALKPGGVWFVSYKVGEGDRVHGERLFSDHTEASLRRWVEGLPGIEVVSTCVRPDLRGLDSLWINAVLRRVA